MIALDCEQSLVCSKMRGKNKYDIRRGVSCVRERRSRQERVGARRRAKRETALLSHSDCEAL